METNFSNTPKINGKPFSRRIGDNLIERDSCGYVCYCIGYYSPSQILARELAGERWAKKIQNIIAIKSVLI
ncbi:MAG: hypothetical protein SV375_14435 [Thermodesulfobacteriota bacterium]|nr:hypothetical protein [Thermodesulfobacteriota bacterium]